MLPHQELARQSWHRAQQVEALHLLRAKADAATDRPRLRGAKWKGGIVINKPPIQLFGLRWRVTILEKHMQIGCELHKLSDWAEYDDERIARMDGRNALRFWRAHKDVLLGLAKSAGRCVADETAKESA